MSDYYTLTEVAHQLGLKYYRIAYQHKVGKLAEPLKAGGRRAYGPDDVLRVAVHFGVPAQDPRSLSEYSKANSTSVGQQRTCVE